MESDTPARDTARAMSQQDIENTKRGYAAVNAAYRSGDASDLLPILEELWDPEAVLLPAGVLPDSRARPHRGRDAFLQFLANQMEAFTELRIEPLEFIEIGECLVVPFRLGGLARHTGIPVEFSFVHVFTFRGGKVTRCEVLKTKAEALEAAGLSE
jgi:ketosteroid isomerase-like protein